MNLIGLVVQLGPQPVDLLLYIQDVGLFVVKLTDGVLRFLQSIEKLLVLVE